MKYYCENCGAEWDSMKIGYSRCPFCKHEGLVTEIPAYETVAEWEKRRGEKYPGTAPVYCFYTEDGEGEAHWHCSTRENAQFFETTTMQIVATEAGAPPDDWRPE
ncbi:MAG: hypothetical protein Pg6C_18290 [Treponemataceae bacterium]|nr:MAG: hypothetical protein Pg6C_18290 [Treponemataceae bacterium]